MSGAAMAAEIAEQPGVFRRILREGRPAIDEAARAVAGRAPRFVMFVARGTSDHAALYGAYLVGTRLGLPVGSASPSTLTVYGTRPRWTDALVVGVSQSGASPDIVEPLSRAREAGATTIAVTNAPGSPLARAAEFHLPILAGPERAVAATKSYTAELLTLYLLVEALAGGSGEEADGLADRAQAVLDRGEEIARLAARYRFAEQLVVTARGYNYATAREAALKLMETSYLVAHGFSSADLLHGPMAMIDRGFPVVAVAPNGPGGDALAPVLARLREMGADTLVVGNPPSTDLATVAFPMPDVGPEVLSPMLAILPLQLLALHLARERGIDPDRPRGLRKVTETW